MGVSDFRQTPPSSSLFRLVRPAGAPPGGSPWLPRILLGRLDATSDPGLSVDARPTASAVVACWVREPIGQIQRCRFRDSTSSGSASTCYLCTSPPFVPTHQRRDLPRLSPRADRSGRRDGRRAVKGSDLARSLPDRLGRIEFTCVTDGSFVSGCFSTFPRGNAVTTVDFRPVTLAWEGLTPS